MDGLEFDGLNDLVDGLENAVSKYPDLAEASLKREQRDFKKDMIRETWSAVDKHTGCVDKILHEEISYFGKSSD